MNVELLLTRVEGPPATDEEIQEGLNDMLIAADIPTSRSLYQVVSIRHKSDPVAQSDITEG